MDQVLSLLPMGTYSLLTIVWILATAFVAGLARGFSGFGAALIFTPLASLSIGPRMATPLLFLVDLIATVGLLPDAWRRANKKEILVMTLGALVGTPLGVWFLVHADPTTIRWAIVVATIPMLFLLISGWRYQGTPKKSLTVGVGSLSGFFSGLAQIGGPPVVLYWLGGENKSDVIRANIILFFLATKVFAGVGYVVGGLFTGTILGWALLTIPVYGLAVWIGSKMFGLASERTFRNISYALIASAILISLPILDGVIR